MVDRPGPARHERLSLDAIRRAPPAMQARMLQEARTYMDEDDLKEFMPETPPEPTPGPVLPCIAGVLTLDPASLEAILKHATISKDTEAAAFLSAFYRFLRTGEGEAADSG